MGQQPGSESGQVSELAQATPEGGADGAPGTEDGTPAAADAQHSPHEGPRDYAGGGDNDDA